MNYTLLVISFGSAILGLISGSLGTLAVVRKQSLVGDAVSHAALPGIVLAFMFTGQKNALVLIIGAIAAGWLGTLLVQFIVRNSKIKFDTALATLLSVFFGFGLMLLTYLQKKPKTAQAGLDKFLFGQAATLLINDIVIMIILGLAAFIIVLLFWKVWKVISFDIEYAESIGIPTRFFDALFKFIIVIAIVIGLQIVGVILISAMLIAPAVAARQWTDKLGQMTFIAGILGAISGFFGANLSVFIDNLPTGPVVVIALSTAVLISILFAKRNGIIWKYFERKSNKREISIKILLKSFYDLSLEHKNFDHPHDLSVISIRLPKNQNIKRCMEKTEEEGLIEKKGDKWALTLKGLNYIKSDIRGGEINES
jgi:manganese/zinc/iron transport system permease protein